MNTFVLLGVTLLLVQIHSQSSSPKYRHSYKDLMTNAQTCSLNDIDESETAKLKAKRPKCTADKGCDIPLNCHNYTTTNATLGEAQVIQVTPLQLQSILEDASVNNSCALVMFYAPWCEYSARFAARFNTVGRMYRELPVIAVDLSVSDPHKYVLAYLPVVALYHKGRTVYRFTLKESLDELTHTISNFTEFPPLPPPPEEDGGAGPVPVERVREELPFVYLSACWIVFVVTVLVFRSNGVSDCIRRLWGARAA